MTHRETFYKPFSYLIDSAGAQRGFELAKVVGQLRGPGHAHPGLIGMATNLPLLCGLALYGLSTVLLVLALKDGELSLLYPVIALTYVWVTVLSLVILHDKPNPYKLAGIAVIVIGVSVLGRGGKK